MTTGEKIKKARTSKGLTQKELGALVGLPDDRIRKYELNIRTPKRELLQKIADHTGFSVEFFTDHLIDS